MNLFDKRADEVDEVVVHAERSVAEDAANGASTRNYDRDDPSGLLLSGSCP